MTKIEKVLKYVKAQIARLSPYIYGAQGQLLSKINLEKLARMETSPENAGRVAQFIYKNLGRVEKKSKVYDCSGFVICAYIYAGVFSKSYDTTADGLYHKFTPISKTARKPGDLIFKVDKTDHAYHVGIVLDNVDRISHCKGRDWGVVEEAYKDDEWQAVRRVIL